MTENDKTVLESVALVAGTLARRLREMGQRTGKLDLLCMAGVLEAVERGLARILLLGVLLLTLGGCWVDVLANPTDPQWDSLQVTGAYQTQGTLTLFVLVGVIALAGALAAALLRGRR